MSAPGPITIVMLVCIRDLEAYIAQGWYCGGLLGRHPVQAHYGRCYIWRPSR